VDLFLVNATFWYDEYLIGVYDSHEAASAAISEAELLRDEDGLRFEGYRFEIQQIKLNEFIPGS
jgi:hypothetical protein